MYPPMAIDRRNSLSPPQQSLKLGPLDADDYVDIHNAQASARLAEQHLKFSAYFQFFLVGALGSLAIGILISGHISGSATDRKESWQSAKEIGFGLIGALSGVGVASLGVTASRGGRGRMVAEAQPAQVPIETQAHAVPEILEEGEVVLEPHEVAELRSPIGFQAPMPEAPEPEVPWSIEPVNPQFRRVRR